MLDNRALSIVLLIAVVGDFAAAYGLAPFYRGYSHRKSVMSVLGSPASPVRRVYNAWLVLLGVLLLVSCRLIYLKFLPVSKSLSAVAVILTAAFAIGACIVAGLFSVNERKEVVTTASKIHGAGAAVGFMLLLFAPLLLVILFFKGGDASGGIFSLVCFAAAFIFFALFVMADKKEFQSTIVAQEGLWQRLTLLMMYIPFAKIALSELI